MQNYLSVKKIEIQNFKNENTILKKCGKDIINQNNI